MALSIFNFDRSKREKVFWLILFLGIAFFLLANTVVHYKYNNYFTSQIQEEIFWQNKVKSTQKFQMLLLGDSRCYRGISPEILQQELSIDSIYNFGLSSGGHNRKNHLFAEKNHLHPDEKKQRIIALCISPFSLTAESIKNEHLQELQKQYSTTKKHKNHSWLWQGNIYRIYRRAKKFSKRKEKMPAEEFFPASGWCKTNNRLTSSQDSGLKTYKATFAKTQFSPQALQETVQMIKHWRQQNIIVFAFRIPSLPAMEKLEDEYSGCNMESIRKAITKEGAIWLDFPDRKQYNAYDASHLNAEEAQRFSRSLAIAIKPHLAEKQ